MMTSRLYPPFAGQVASPGAGARALPRVAPTSKLPGNGRDTHPSAGPSPSPLNPAARSHETPHDQHPSIEVVDWDILFSAIEVKLREAVGGQLGVMLAIPAHSAQLSASLVQATVLDCVDALHKLHAAIKHDRSQRPTP